MVDVNLKRTFFSGEWERGVAIKDNVIIVEKASIWPMYALLNIKLQLTHLNTPKIVLIQRLSNRLTSGHLTIIFSHLNRE